METKLLALSQPDVPGDKDTLAAQQVYEIKGKTFIVEPVFPKDAEDTLGAALLRLMQNDCMGHF